MDPADETPIIKVCVGPPCDSSDYENCRLCTVIDPFDENWESALDRAQRPQ